MDDDWNTAQWIIFGIVIGWILIKSIFSLKNYLKLRRLRLAGNRKCDFISQQLYTSYKANGLLMCMFGFEVSSDSITPSHFKDMARDLMRSFINFRSLVHDVDNIWYFREEFDPEKANMDQYVTVIPLELDINDNGGAIVSSSADPSHSCHDDDAEINEKILQRAIQWMNENRAFNIDMMESQWQKAHFDILYFHFQSLSKCVVCFRVDHGLGDGMTV